MAPSSERGQPAYDSGTLRDLLLISAPAIRTPQDRADASGTPVLETSGLGSLSVQSSLLEHTDAAQAAEAKETLL
ncbi:hypothetical protein CGCS363_v010755 [Colletotrichum siamense]|uniref:uncharacterized protein n=1 Tax=Colletotrichum siamense TaxID=690259 RepID=UPI001872CCE7|nr:uncharacterized protein CGCS363_v010755 [Colletotrichum siamense]KAF5492394.1 hypothetical protein CGCS363_v010755 [Colletotrichum siamense]